jgi:hypothetical protein
VTGGGIMSVYCPYWADIDYWTVHEAACLLNRIDPHDPIDTSRSDSDLLNDEENVRIYKELISRASKAGTIKTFEDGGLDPKSVLEWTEKKRIEVPYKLREAMDWNSATSELRTDHVDKNMESTQSPPYELSFFKNGQIWKIGEVGREMDFLHIDGLKYIHFLLQHEHKELNSLEVHRLGEVPPELKDEQENSFQAKNDPISKTKYYEGLELLKEKLSVEEDFEKREEIQEDINYISKQLQDKGHGFQSGNKEKARQSVQKAIKSALEKIQKECPKAYEHLSDPIIKTGISCRYSPLKSIPWKLNP